MKAEFEVIQHPQIKHLNLFLVDIRYRSPHYHVELELDLILDGEVSVLSPKGNWRVPSGNLLLLNSNQGHELKAGEGAARILCMQISPSILKYIYPVADSLSFDNCFPFDCMALAVIFKLRRTLIGLGLSYFEKALYYELECLGRLNFLLHDLMKYVPYHRQDSLAGRTVSKQVARLDRIIRYVDEHYGMKLRLSDLAEAEGLSLSYLSHFIKDHLHQTFQEYVESVRFNCARRLLLTSEKPILDISIESGFSDPRYLTRAFLKRTGQRPDTFRRQHFGQLPAAETRAKQSLQRYNTPQESLEILRGYRFSPTWERPSPL